MQSFILAPLSQASSVSLKKFHYMLHTILFLWVLFLMMYILALSGKIQFFKNLHFPTLFNCEYNHRRFLKFKKIKLK